MIALQRAHLRVGAKSPWLRPPQNRPLRAQRNSSNTNTNAQSDSTKNLSQKLQLSQNAQKVATEGTRIEQVDIPIQLWYHRLGPVTTFFSWFHKTQTKRPYTVQLCTTLTTYLAGDLLAQDIGGEPYDPIRTLRMLTIGALAAIPGYRWFLFLGKNFNFSSKVGSIATKVAINQACFTPVFNTYFFGMQAILTGEPPSGVIARIKGAVPVSIVNSLKLWPAVTAFTFWVIPLQYRFMFSGVFAVAWQCYLSFLNRKEEKIELATDTLTRPAVLESPEK